MPIPSSPDVDDALRCLRGGGVLAYPTEGVYGLGCDARDKKCCERVIALKQRRPEQGMIVLVDDWLRLKDWLQPLSELQQAVLSQRRHEFITWLLPANSSAPSWLTGGRDTLAARIPLWRPFFDLCARFATPLLSTSANPHGRPAVTNSADVQAYFDQGVDWLWDYPCGGQGRASSIISLQSGEQLR